MRTLLITLALLASPFAASAQTIGDALDLMEKTQKAEESVCPPARTRGADDSLNTDHVYCRMTFRNIYARSHRVAFDAASQDLGACALSATPGSGHACAKLRAVKLSPQSATKLLDEQKKYEEALRKRTR